MARVAPVIGAEFSRLLTRPLNENVVVGLGEGVVAVPLSTLHAPVQPNAESRTKQPGLMMFIWRASAGSRLETCTIVAGSASSLGLWRGCRNVAGNRIRALSSASDGIRG